MPPIHVLIKPASGLCNLRCKYCFYHDVAGKRQVESYGIMGLDTLENVLRGALEFGQGDCTIAYQGGEPTMAGLDFFRRSVELQERHNVNKLRIHNAIQTNGYRLGEDWARFFKDNRFLVGLSVDGVKDVHDAHRVDVSGKGTFNQVMKTAALFDRVGVEYNILTVVNNLVAKRAAAIYGFYKKRGFRYLQFIPCLDPLGEPFGQNPYSLTAPAYGRFLCALFDLWHRDLERGDAPSIRDFDNYVQMLLGYPPESCNMRGVCGYQNVVEADGSVYPCDFYTLDEMRLGSLNEEGFEEIYRRREEMGFIGQSVQVDEACQACPHYSLCRGGCRRHREPFRDGKPRRTFFCEAYRMFFEHAMGRMQTIARSIQARSGRLPAPL